MLPSVPRPASPAGRARVAGGGGGGLICSFLEVHLEHGLSKVYIFIFLYQGFIGVSGEGRGYLAAYFLLEYVWQITQLHFRQRENLQIA